MQLPFLRRRSLLAGGAAFVGAPLAANARGAALVVAQLVDTSPGQQDIARDFLIGSRAAWQDINADGGVRRRPVQHLAIEVDGTAPSVRQACRAAIENPACVVLSDSVSDPVAVQAIGALRAEAAAIAHAAPWLQRSGVDIDDRTFPIFAGGQEQIAHAIRSLSVMGVSEVGAVFASAREYERYHRDVAGSAAALRVKLAIFRGEADLERMGRQLGPSTPPLLLFLGGTPELVRFTRGLDRQARQRYVIALGDVNLQTVMQMGAGRSTPVIATQAVPTVGAALPVVRRYRDALARLFDEPPVALGLAGFIAARYTWEVLKNIDGAVTRASALAAFQRRAEADLGGYRVRFDESGRSAGFVTQSMLTADGRVVG